MFAALRDLARDVKRDLIVLFRCARDSRVPWYATAAAALVAAYALSPIDLIPDFLPVIGYLDDIVIVPLGILLVVRLIPTEVLLEHRRAVGARQGKDPVSWFGLWLVVSLWMLSAGFIATLVDWDLLLS